MSRSHLFSSALRHPLNYPHRLPIQHPIHLRLPIAALEGAEDGREVFLQVAIADAAERGLGRLLVRLPRRHRPRPGSMAGRSQSRPVEELAGIFLTERRHVRMAHDSVARNAPAHAQHGQQFQQHRHLRLREGAVAPLVARVDQLDPDRAIVDAALALPEGEPGVPGSATFRHKAPEGAVLLDAVVGRHPRGRIAEALDRLLAAAHAGVVQHDEVGITLIRPRVMVWRRKFLNQCHGQIYSRWAARWASRGRRSTTMPTPPMVSSPPTRILQVKGSPSSITPEATPISGTMRVIGIAWFRS